MTNETAGYVPQERIRAALHSLHPRDAAAFYGLHWPDQPASGQVRLPCPFNDDCNRSPYGALTLNLDEPHHPVYCHGCHTRGDLLTLMWGWKHHAPPTGGKLRGSEFKEILTDLLAITEGRTETRTDLQATLSRPPPASPAASTPSDAPPALNLPLRHSENERARSLVNLYEQFLIEPDAMSPAAAQYFRSRPWLTPEVAEKWRMGYLPMSSKGLLRGRIVYGYLSERGDLLTWFGRDPEFERKYQKWNRDGEPQRGQPIKTRFVKGFHRGLELYGQQASQLDDPHIRESLDQHGLIVVEGPNDVIRLDCLGLTAVGLCSNRATDEQIAKLIRFARQTAGGRIALMPDLDDEGEAGAKELLWRLSAAEGVSVRLIWSRELQGGWFAGRQPEAITSEEGQLLF